MHQIDFVMGTVYYALTPACGFFCGIAIVALFERKRKPLYFFTNGGYYACGAYAGWELYLAFCGGRNATWSGGQ